MRDSSRGWHGIHTLCGQGRYAHRAVLPCPPQQQSGPFSRHAYDYDAPAIPLKLTGPTPNDPMGAPTCTYSRVATVFAAAAAALTDITGVAVAVVVAVATVA
eukprot:3157022-Rhodomonas_salina.1